MYNNNLSWGVREGNPSVSTGSLSVPYPADGEWHMVAVIVDASQNGILYLDGAEVDSDTTPFWGQIGGIDSVNIGCNEDDTGPQWFFGGQLDDIRIYSYPLDKWAIAQLYIDVEGGSVCIEQPAYDLNDDCKVNLEDLALVAGDWLFDGTK